MKMEKNNYKKKAIIIGAGTYGQVYAEYIKDYGEYDILAFLDDDKKKHGKTYVDIKVLGSVDKLSDFNDKNTISVFVPIGNNVIRQNILTKVKMMDYKTPSFIHHTAQIHNSVFIGNAVYILPSSLVMPHTEIMNNVMISMGVNIAHHTKLHNGCFLSQGVNVGASIDVQENVFIGIASTIMTGVKYIGINSIIGAGSVVIRNVPEYATIVGNPGRVIKIGV